MFIVLNKLLFNIYIHIYTYTYLLYLFNYFFSFLFNYQNNINKFSILDFFTSKYICLDFWFWFWFFLKLKLNLINIYSILFAIFRWDKSVYAIKKISSNTKPNDPKGIINLKVVRESKYLMNLNHPNIVRCY